MKGKTHEIHEHVLRRINWSKKTVWFKKNFLPKMVVLWDKYLEFKLFEEINETEKKNKRHSAEGFLDFCLDNFAFYRTVRCEYMK